MKIDNSNKPVSTPLANSARPSSTGKPAATTGDDVRLSALSAQLAASGDEPVFDSARVSEIKQAISDGRFSINAGAIADRLIATAQELVDSKRQA